MDKLLTDSRATTSLWNVYHNEEPAALSCDWAHYSMSKTPDPCEYLRHVLWLYSTRSYCSGNID